MRHEEAPAISLTGPGAITPAPNAAHWLSAAPITSGTPAGRPSSPATRSGSSAAWAHGGRAAGNSAGSTPKAASSSGSHARWRRLNSSVAFALRLVGGGHAGQPVQDHVPRLEDQPGPGEDLRLVLPDPQQLRPDVERLRQVPGPLVHDPIADAVPHLAGLGHGPVVPVHHPGAQRPPAGVGDHHGRALAGQADGADRAPPRRVRAASPRSAATAPSAQSAGVLLGPAGPGRGGLVRPAHLGDEPAVQVVGHRAGAGRARVDRRHQRRAGADGRGRVATTGHWIRGSGPGRAGRRP